MVKNRIRVTYVTTNRADYEPMRTALKVLHRNSSIELSIVVTGSHLLDDFGRSVSSIVADQLNIVAEIPIFDSSDQTLYPNEILRNVSINFCNLWSKNSPDLLLILGDRYELLPICALAVVLKIPIAHISGGDLTEGAIDDQVRHSITKMASLHFPGNRDSADVICQMGEEPWRIHSVGEPGLDILHSMEVIDRHELASVFDLDCNKKWVLLAFHPETMNRVSTDIARLERLISIISRNLDRQIIATYPNSDVGSSEIIELYKKFAANRPESLKIIRNAEQINFINLMRQSTYMVGNSSSIIFETPSLELPAINVGRRQEGRFFSANIVSVSGDNELEIEKAIEVVESPDFRTNLDSIPKFFGDGFAGQKMASILESLDINRLLPKKFRKVTFNL